MIKDNVRIIKDFFKLVKGKKIWVILMFTGSIMAHLSSLLLPVFASNIILYVTEGNFDLTYWNILYLAITYVFYNLFWYLNYTSYSHNFKYSFCKLREKILEKVSTYDADFTKKISKGTILNTFNNDTSDLGEMFDYVCEIIVGVIKIIALIIIFFTTNIFIGLFVLFLELIYLKTYDYCNIKTAKYLTGQRKYRDKLTDNLSQTLNGMGEIKMLNIFEKIKNGYNVLTKKWSEQYMKKRKYTDTKQALLPIIVHFGKIILYVILAWLVLSGYYEINMLVLLITYFESIVTNTEGVMKYSGQIREYSVSIKRIDAVLNYNGSKPIEFGINDNDYINGLVQFKNVSFSYKNTAKSKDDDNINNISFIAKPNQITALVGQLGSGKTTIVNLLLRKNEVDSGHIYIDGDDIYSYSKKVYSTNVIGANQTPFVFNMSIRKNLSLVDSRIEHQVDACRRVGIHDYIMSLPKGYNTILSEDTSNFSEGQKQLLSIARILLCKAEILVFDEVTSSLDPVLIERIKELFVDLKQDHTVIVVTHQRDIMSVADNIIVLNDGKIVGRGNHTKLLAGNKYYKNLLTATYCPEPEEKVVTEVVMDDDDSDFA